MLGDINIYDSSSLDDLKRYTPMALETDPTISSFEYLGDSDLANAHTWTHEQFGYDINQYGLRENNDPTDMDIAAFGCSFTFGSGLPSDRLWHKLLANKLNTNSYNFGSPAKSIESIVDMFLIASKHVTIKRAIFLFPMYTRIQIAKTHPHNDTIINYVNTDLGYKSSSLRYYGIDTDLIYRAVPEEELFKKCRNSIYLLEHFAKIRNVKVYISSWERTTYDFISTLNLNYIKLLPAWESPSPEFTKHDLARDGLHPGMKHHELWTNAISEYINA